MIKTIVVKTVKGYEITRRENERGHFEVTLKAGEKWRQFVTFKTIKAAAEYIENNL